MTDLFLQQRQSNRGCLILGVLGVLCLGFVAWILFRKDAPEPGPATGAEASSASETAATPASDAPRSPGNARSAPSTPGPGRTTSPASAAPLKSTAALVGELAQARTLMAQGELEKARDLARQLAADGRNAETKNAAENLLGEIHLALAFSPSPMAEKIEYKIRPGDSLGNIAKKHNTTLELLQKGNGITGNLIRAGQKLKVLPGNFKVLVDKSDFTLTVLYDGKFFKRYLIGTGKDNKTPEGKFKVVDRIKEPDWWRSDGKKIPFGTKENLLGTRWLALDARSYGIHGTWEPETIGKDLSAGCVRMRNEEVEELYELLPIGTPVEIVK